MTLKNTKRYDIIVSNMQKIDNESDIIEEKAEGKYFCRNDKKCIMYNDAQGAVTVIADRRGVRLRRSGGVSCEMPFAPGRHARFLYSLSYGSIEMELYTHEIHDALSEDGGELSIIYELDAGGGASYNSIKITVCKGLNK